MAVSIRLRREGALNRPYYKVVVTDSRSPRDGKLKMDRIEHWMSKGAQPSDTVRSLIKKNRKQAASAPVESSPEPAAPVEEAPAPATAAE
jgi:small subunit ribosomal protein S16